MVSTKPTHSGQLIRLAVILWIHYRFESAVKHALDLERHRRVFHHLLHTRIAHHLRVYLVAIGARLVNDKREHRDLTGLELDSFVKRSSHLIVEIVAD